MKTQRIWWKNQVINQLNRRNVVIIQGLRRIGKTLLARNILEESFDDYLKMEFQVGLFGNDDTSEALKILNLVKSNKDKKYLIFIDEFQDLKDWEKFFRELYDCTNVKALASGSISAMKEGVSYTEGGRFAYIKMPPLSFEEYLEINKDVKGELNDKFNDYSSMGSYPGKDFGTNITEYRRQISENIIEKIKNIETLKSFDLASPQNINVVLMYLISTVGQTLSISGMSEKLNIDRITLEKVINYLKQTFLIYEVNNTKQSKGKAAVGNKKYYLEDHTFYLFARQLPFIQLEESYKGFIFENIIFNQLRSKFDKYEVEIGFEIDKDTKADIDLILIKNDIKKYFEIKYSDSTECLSKNQLEFAEHTQLFVIYNGKTTLHDKVQFINVIDFILNTSKWV